MPTCLPSWGGIGPVLGCSHCPQFHWDVTDWAILILCHVADSCCGQFCVPGCVNRVLFWCLAPDSRLNPDLPLLSTPLEQLTGALRAFLRVRDHTDQDLLDPGSRGRRCEHSVLSGTRWFFGGCQVGRARPLTDCLWLGAESGSARPSFSGLIVLQWGLKGPEARRQAFPSVIHFLRTSQAWACWWGWFSVKHCSVFWWCLFSDLLLRLGGMLFPVSLLIIFLREFLSSDATGSEGVTSMKALDLGCLVPPHSGTAQLSQPRPPAAVPQPCSPRCVSIFADWRQKQVSAFSFALSMVWAVFTVCLLADCLLCASFKLPLPGTSVEGGSPYISQKLSGLKFAF